MKSGLESEWKDIASNSSGGVVHQRDPVSDPSWDSKLVSHSTAAFFHTRAWAKVLHDSYGFKSHYLELELNGRTEAILPLMEVDSWLTGRRGVSLPFTDECAPIFSNTAAADRLYQEALSYGRARKWKYVEFRGSPPSRPIAEPSLTYVGHRLDLTGCAAFEGFDSSTKRAVRKAQSYGLRIEFSRELESIRTFYNLFSGTRKRLGVPPQPFEFFANVHRHILCENHGCVVLAWHGNTAVAGAVFFNYLKSGIYKFGASDARFLHLRANNLVMSEAIKHYQCKGFEVLEFGRTSGTNKGLLKFKQNWGATPYEISYFRHNLQTGGIDKVVDTAEGHAQMLGLLPTPVFKLIGSVFYRHMT